MAGVFEGQHASGQYGYTIPPGGVPHCAVDGDGRVRRRTRAYRHKHSRDARHDHKALHHLPLHHHQPHQKHHVL